MSIVSSQQQATRRRYRLGDPANIRIVVAVAADPGNYYSSAEKISCSM